MVPGWGGEEGGRSISLLIHELKRRIETIGDGIQMN